MSNYKSVTTTGPVRWAKVFESNRDLEGYQGAAIPTEGEYQILQIMDKDEYQKLVDANSQKRPKQKLLMDEGVIGVQFSRPHKVTNRSGQVIEQAGGAPIVTHVDGTPWDLDVDGPIGNDSVCEIKTLISKGQTSSGETFYRTSLMEVKVIEHVIFEQEEVA